MKRFRKLQYSYLIPIVLATIVAPLLTTPTVTATCSVQFRSESPEV